MKKVLIYGVYDWNNLGDDLMMYCIKNKLQSENIIPIFIKSHDDNYFYENYNYDSILNTDKISKNKILNTFLKFTQLIKFKKNNLKDYDSIIFMGGGYVNRCIGSGYFKLLYILLLKNIFKHKKVFFSGQTIGPQESRLDRIIIKKIYKNANIFVREQNSFELLNKLGIKSTIAGDDAFLITSFATVSNIESSKYILVNFKDFDGYNKINDEFIQLIINIVKKMNYKIILLPFRNNISYKEYQDHLNYSQYLTNMGIDNDIVITYSVDELVSYVKKCEFMIGTAYHFVALGILYNKYIYTGYIGEYYKTKIEGIIKLNNYEDISCYNLEENLSLSYLEKDILGVSGNKKKNSGTNCVDKTIKNVNDEWNKIVCSIKREKK